MLFRAVDCGIYEDSTEPGTIAWISAHSAEQARTSLIEVLARTWHVEHWSVFFSNLSPEWELEQNSGQDASAGDRRWHEMGWVNGVPLYDDFANTLVFLGARDRTRLYRAWASARTHAAECAAKVDAYAAHLAEQGKAREAAFTKQDADEHRRLAEMLPFGVADSNASAAAGYLKAHGTELRRIVGLLELARMQREDRKHKAANDNETLAHDRLIRLVGAGVRE